MAFSLLLFRASTVFVLVLWSFQAVATRTNAARDRLFGHCVDIFEVSDVVSNRTDGPNTENNFFSDGKIPAHLQYTLYLDQSKLMRAEQKRFRLFAVEEISVRISQGDFFFKDNTVSQEQDRCEDQMWTYVWNRKTFRDNIFTPFRLSGKVIYLLSHLMNYCKLVFEWNIDFTVAYLYVKGAPLFNFITSWHATLLPFWAWKFGISQPVDTSKLEEMDAKCCPPKPGGPVCTGGGVLGTPNDPCETISMACGVPRREDMEDCAMWLRDAGPDRRLGYTYLLYPIGDKNQSPTGFYNRFKEGMEEAGIKQLFQGTGTSTSSSC